MTYSKHNAENRVDSGPHPGLCWGSCMPTITVTLKGTGYRPESTILEKLPNATLKGPLLPVLPSVSSGYVIFLVFFPHHKTFVGPSIQKANRSQQNKSLNGNLGTSLVVQRLRLPLLLQEMRLQSSLQGAGSGELKNQKPKQKQQKQYCNKFNKDFKKWSTLKKILLKNKWKLMEEYLQREDKHLKDGQHH